MTRPASAPLRLERRPSLARAAADRLRRAILDGEFRQSQHLVEAEMARRMGISRGPLREAFKLLAAEGLVEIREDRGVFVPSPSDDEVEQMIVARAMLEGTAARLFVLRAGHEHRARLAELIVAMEAEAVAVAGSRAWREIDWRFHETVLEGAGNAFLRKSWTAIGALLRLYMMQMNPLYDRQRDRVIETHRRLAAALLGSDPAAAEALFRQTILTTGYFVLGRMVPEGLTEAPPTAALGGQR
ncbi:MAG: GntR family transcriptional regulator [Rhodobacteraceae bacterium]|jgi:DNA-binding GntR family transcriptional regulator|nr:GntR family transcriptional regulator [Paracoccaceae bacterium]